MADSFALRGKLRREKCNMLQKSLVEIVLMVNVGMKKAFFSCRNGIEIEYREKKGYNRREKCNMLQKSLLKKVN